MTERGQEAHGPTRTELFRLREKVAELEAENARLRDFAVWCSEVKEARLLWADMSDADWFEAINDRAVVALQEGE